MKIHYTIFSKLFLPIRDRVTPKGAMMTPIEVRLTCWKIDNITTLVDDELFVLGVKKVRINEY